MMMMAGLAAPPTGAAHALLQRAHRIRGIDLQHPVGITRVDAQLQGDGPDDAGASAIGIGRAPVERLLGEQALLLGHGAVVHELPPTGPGAASNGSQPVSGQAIGCSAIRRGMIWNIKRGAWRGIADSPLLLLLCCSCR